MAASKSNKMLLVTDRFGSIVAAARIGKSGEAGVSIGISPMPGQQIHEVDVPEAILKLDSGNAFHQAISQAKLNPTTGKIEFKPVTHKRVTH